MYVQAHTFNHMPLRKNQQQYKEFKMTTVHIPHF